MKKPLLLVVVAALFFTAAIGLGFMLTPQVWPITANTLKVSKVDIHGQKFVKIEGEAMNYLSQFQIIETASDAGHKKLKVNRYRVFWNPFTKIIINQQWPVFFPLESLPPGKYSVLFQTKDGEATAGTFDVP